MSYLKNKHGRREINAVKWGWKNNAELHSRAMLGQNPTRLLQNWEVSEGRKKNLEENKPLSRVKPTVNTLLS